MPVKVSQGKLINTDKSPLAQFTEAEINMENKAIAQVLGLPEVMNLSLPQSCKEKLINAIRLYYSHVRYLELQPKPSEVKQQLKKLLKSCHALSNCWENLNFVGRDMLKALPVDLSWSSFQDIEDLGDETTIFAELIGEQAHKALANIPSGKKAKDLTWRHFVLRLIDVYFEATGKKAGYTWSPNENKYAGPFFNFSYACLSALGTGVTNQSLGDYLKEVINSSRKPGGQRPIKGKSPKK